MKKSEKVFSILKNNRLIALLSPKNVDQCLSAYEIVNPYGAILEIALRTESAIDGIKAILKKYPDALLLAGTVMTRQQAEAAIQAGAAGIVSADYIPAVVETCVVHDIMCVPGGLTDAGKQLSQKADLYGCDLLELPKKYPYQWIYKLFPTFAGSKSYAEFASALRAPFKDLNIIYAGGITKDNLTQLIQLDSNALICGSALTLSIDHPKQMKQEVEKWIDIIHGHKEKNEKVVPSKPAQRKSDAKVVTLGEIMLRLSTPSHLRFVQTKTYDAKFGGAEANVAVGLAIFGISSCFVTSVPDNEIGQAAINTLRSFGVDTNHILHQGNRLGIYFLEQGASQRPSKVIYDRAESSISQVKPGQFDWEEIFKNTAWFHWSGITPALNDSIAEVLWEALKAAQKAGVTISADLNYRKKLWSKEKARSVIIPLMEYVNICIANEEDAECVFGIKAGTTDAESGQLDIKAYEKVAKQLIYRFGFQKVAITLRESISASDNIWSACLYNGKDFLHSTKYPIHIIDRVGSGDAFCAGLIYGILTGKSDQQSLDFATAASCLKHTIPGDFNLVSVQEVEQLLSGKTGGRVQR